MNLTALLGQPYCIHPLFGQSVVTALQCANADLRLTAIARQWGMKAQTERDGNGSGSGYIVTKDGIAVLSISGPLAKKDAPCASMFGGTSTVRMRQALRNAIADPDVRGVMLVIDSPGGQVAGTSDLAADIKNARKPVYGYAQDMAASAGYWLLSSCERCYANDTATIGSIGTYMAIEDTSESAKAQGVTVHIVASGPYKGAGEDGTAVTEDHLSDFRRTVNDLNENFISAVKSGRRHAMNAEQVRDHATGQVWVGEKAAQHGLIDGVTSLSGAVRKLKERIAAGSAPNGKEKASMGFWDKLSHKQRDRVVAILDDDEVENEFPELHGITRTPASGGSGATQQQRPHIEPHPVLAAALAAGINTEADFRALQANAEKGESLHSLMRDRAKLFANTVHGASSEEAKNEHDEIDQFSGKTLLTRYEKLGAANDKVRGAEGNQPATRLTAPSDLQSPKITARDATTPDQEAQYAEEEEKTLAATPAGRLILEKRKSNETK